MRRSTITNAVVLCLFALTSTSFAGNWSNNQNRSHKKTPNAQNIVQKLANPTQMPSQPLFTGSSNNSDSNKKYKKHNKQDDNINNILPLDPGRGDGRVPTNPSPSTSTPTGKPGFVWVGDHWERARAPLTSTTTPTGKPGFVWVGDHWERARAPLTSTTTPTGKPGFVWVGDHWERARAPVTSTSTPTGKLGFVWVGDHWERAKAPVTSTTTPTGKPGFVWVGDHWERAKAPVTSTSTPTGKPGFVWVGDHWERAKVPATISITSASQGSQSAAYHPFAANPGDDGRHRNPGMATNNPGIPPAFLNMANSPPPAISKPTWDSGKLSTGVTVRPGSPNRADVTGGGWGFPTIEIEGELNPAYDSDRDHRTGNPIPTYGSSLPWPFGP